MNSVRLFCRIMCPASDAMMFAGVCRAQEDYDEDVLSRLDQNSIKRNGQENVYIKA